MQFLINTSIWFQEWVRLFVNDAEKNSQLGQRQDTKKPIKLKHSPVCNFTYHRKWSVNEHSDHKIYSDKSNFQTNKRKRKLSI